MVTAPHQSFDFDQQHYDDGVYNGDDDNDIFQLVHDDPDDDTVFMIGVEQNQKQRSPVISGTC